MVSLTNLAGGNNINIVINAVDNFSKTMGKIKNDVKKDFGSKTGAFAGLATSAGVAAVAIGGVGLAMTSLVKEYTKFEPVQRNFNNLMGDDAEESIQMFRKAASGLIDDFALMKNANLLFMNISSATPEQFSKMTKAAVLLGRAVGIDATQAFERLTLGIAKGETELLDELGLKLDATIANKVYAESIGKTTSELTAAERATAALNFILPTLEDRISNLSGLQEDAGTSMERLNVQWANTKRSLGEFFAPQVEVASQALTGFFKSTENAANGNNNLVKSLTNVVGNFFVFGGQIKLALQGVELVLAGFRNTMVGTMESFTNTFVDSVNVIINAANKMGANLSTIEQVDFSHLLFDTKAIKDEMLETNAAIEKVRKQSLGLIEKGSLLGETTFTQNVAQTAAASVPTTSQVTVSQLETLKRNAIEQAFILDEIGGKQAELNAIVAQSQIFAAGITAANASGGKITINIENLNGLDPTEIANALQDTLSNQIR